MADNNSNYGPPPPYPPPPLVQQQQPQQQQQQQQSTAVNATLDTSIVDYATPIIQELKESLHHAETEKENLQGRLSTLLNELAAEKNKNEKIVAEAHVIVAQWEDKAKRDKERYVKCQKEVNDKTRELDEAQRQGSESRSQLNTVHGQLIRVKHELALAQEACEEAVRDFEKLKREHDRSERDAYSSSEQLAALREAHDKLADESQQRSDDYAGLQKEFESKCRALDKAGLEAEKWEGDCIEANELVKALSLQIHNLKQASSTQAKEHEDAIADATCAREGHKDEIREIREELQRVNGDLTVLSKENQELQKEVHDLRDENRMQDLELEKHIVAAREASAEIASLTEQLNAKAAAADDWQSQFRALSLKHDETESDVTQLRHDKSALDAKLREKTAECSAKLDELADINTAVASLRDDLQRRRDTIISLDSTVAELRAGIEAKTAENGALDQKNAELMSQCVLLEEAAKSNVTEIGTLEGRLSEQMNELIEARARAEKVESEIAALTPKLQDGLQKIAQLEQEASCKALQHDEYAEAAAKSASEAASNIATLNETVAALEQTIATHTGTISDKSSKLDTLAKELAAHRKSNESVTSRLSDLEPMCAQLEAEVASSKAKTAQLDAELEKTKEQLSNVTFERDERDASIEQLSADTKAKGEKIEDLTTQLNMALMDMSVAQKDIQVSQHKIQSLTTRLTDQEQLTQNVEQEGNQLHKKFLASQSNLNQIQSQQAEASGELTQLRSKHAELEQTLKDKEIVIKNLTTQNEALQDEMNNLTTAFGDMQMQVEKAQTMSEGEVDIYREEVQKLQGNIDFHLSKQHELEKEIEKHVGDKTALKRKYDAAVAQLADSKASQTVESSRVDELRQELRSAKDNVQDLEATIAAERETHKRAKAELATQARDARSTESEKQSLKSKLEGAAAARDKAETEVKSLARRIETLREEVQVEQRKHQNAKDAYENWRTRSQKDQDVISERDAEIQKLLTHHDNVVAKYNALYEVHSGTKKELAQTKQLAVEASKSSTSASDEVSSQLQSLKQRTQEDQTLIGSLRQRLSELTQHGEEHVRLMGEQENERQRLRECVRHMLQNAVSEQQQQQQASGSIVSTTKGSFGATSIQPLNINEGPRRLPKKRMSSRNAALQNMTNVAPGSTAGATDANEDPNAKQHRKDARSGNSNNKLASA